MRKPVYLLTLVLIVLFISGCTSSSTNKQINTVARPDLGITSTEFKNRLNRAIKEVGTSVTVEELKDQSLILHSKSPYISMLNMYTNNDKLESVSLTSVTDGSKSTVYNAVILAGLVVMVINPELTAEERGILFGDLGLLDKQTEEINKTVIKNGIKYNAIYKSDKGMSFHVSKSI